jgi:isopenicillin N synthase-like dioxygenase
VPLTTDRYFPLQAGADNLKEGFELGTPSTRTSTTSNLVSPKFNLTEPNVFPASLPSFRIRCETLHTELQSLSSRLLSLLAEALGKPSPFFDHYLTDSLSTLRLLHYPPVPANRQQEFICTPHTDVRIFGSFSLLSSLCQHGLHYLSHASPLETPRKNQC